MKFFTRFKKISIVALVFAGVLGFGYGVLAQSGSGVSRFIQEDGLQTKHGRIVVMDMGEEYPSEELDDPSGIFASNSLINDLKLYIDSGMATLSNLETSSRAYILGSNEGEPVRVTLGSDIPDNAATLTVAGNILGTDYTDLSEPNDRYLCADANGRIEVCGSVPTEPEPPVEEPINGQCAEFSETYESQPATNTNNGCEAGNYVDVDDTDAWQWLCEGSNGGAPASCSADMPPATEVAQCGPSDGEVFTSTPTTGLCDVGTASEVSTSAIPQVEGICTGTYTTSGTTQEVDWNGDPFDADPYGLYTADGTKIAQCSSEIAIIGVPSATDRYFLRTVMGLTPPYAGSPVSVSGGYGGNSYVDRSFYCDRLIDGYNEVSGPVYVQGPNVNWTALTIVPADWEAEIVGVSTMQGSYIDSSGGQTYQCSDISPNYVEDYCVNGGFNGCVWDPGTPASTTYEWTCTEGSTTDDCFAFGSSCEPPTLTSLSPGTPGDVSFDLDGQTNVSEIEIFSSNDNQSSWSYQGSATSSPGLSAVLDGYSIRARSICDDGTISGYSNILQYND